MIDSLRPYVIGLTSWSPGIAEVVCQTKKRQDDLKANYFILFFISGKSTRAWYTLHNQLQGYEPLMVSLQGVYPTTVKSFWLSIGSAY